MAQSKEVYVRVDCTYIAESDKAVLVSFHDSDGDKLGQRWLPKSRVKQVVRGEGGFIMSGERGEILTVDLPQWLADKDDIAEMIQEQVMASEYEEKEDKEESTGEEYDDDIPF